MFNYHIRTEKQEMDLDFIHHFLYYHSTWSKGIPLEVVKTSIEHSLNFGLFFQETQVGYARVISDKATIAYLGDVFIDEAHRGKGLANMLMETVISHPDLQHLRRWILLTSTAGWLYEKYGFSKLPKPDIYMERYQPEIYLPAVSEHNTGNDG